MKNYFLTFSLILIFTQALFSNDIIEEYKIDSKSRAIFIINHTDTVYSNIAEGKLTYSNGRLNSGLIAIFVEKNSISLSETPEAETFIKSENCIDDDTLRVSFHKTFFNARANSSEPNYTALASICFNGFSGSLAFPVKIIVMETHIKFIAQFSLNLDNIYSGLIYQGQKYSEVELHLKINAIQIIDNEKPEN